MLSKVKTSPKLKLSQKLHILKTKHLLITTIITLTIFALATQNKAYAQDTTPPSTTHKLTPSAPNGENNYYKTPVQIEFSSTDTQSGVREINYRINNGVWQKTLFKNTINIVQNPSFEQISITNETGTNIDKWYASTTNNGAIYEQDNTTAYNEFGNSSAKISSAISGWHFINNKKHFIPAKPLSSMSASVFAKTQNLNGNVYFSVYSINKSGITEFIGNSNNVSGNSDWQKLELNFTVQQADAIGIYLEIGISGQGTAWFDAVTASSSFLSTKTNVTIGSDNQEHTIEFYSKDNAGNAETYNCSSPSKNCIKIKIDTTPPGNWNNAQALKDSADPDNILKVSAEVSDETSGLSEDTNKYIGGYSSCETQELNQNWQDLEQSVNTNGAKKATLITDKIDFCSNISSVCKNVKFYAKDIAGNESTKNFCVNGPWISIKNGGFVRSNYNIEMVSQPAENNTTDIVEASGNIIDFFVSNKNKQLKQAPVITTNSFENYLNSTPELTNISANDLNTNSGVYKIESNLVLDNATLPNGFSNAEFTQIIFVDGNLTIEENINISNKSAILFIVKNDVKISKSVTQVDSAIFTDKDFYTAYNLNEDQPQNEDEQNTNPTQENTNPLTLNGIFKANKFHFQRSLEGTLNSTEPAEIINFEPKYLVKLKNYFGNSVTRWESSF